MGAVNVQVMFYVLVVFKLWSYQRREKDSCKIKLCEIFIYEWVVGLPAIKEPNGLETLIFISPLFPSDNFFFL